jgi:hypothetical protein
MGAPNLSYAAAGERSGKRGSMSDASWLSWPVIGCQLTAAAWALVRGMITPLCRDEDDLSRAGGVEGTGIPVSEHITEF